MIWLLQTLGVAGLLTRSPASDGVIVEKCRCYKVYLASQKTVDPSPVPGDAGYSAASGVDDEPVREGVDLDKDDTNKVGPEYSAVYQAIELVRGWEDRFELKGLPGQDPISKTLSGLLEDKRIW